MFIGNEDVRKSLSMHLTSFSVSYKSDRDIIIDNKNQVAWIAISPNCDCFQADCRLRIRRQTHRTMYLDCYVGNVRVKDYLEVFHSWSFLELLNLLEASSFFSLKCADCNLDDHFHIFMIFCHPDRNRITSKIMKRI